MAGPITLGNIEDNVANAIEVGQVLLGAGYAPFIPHLSHYAEPMATWTQNPTRYEEWLDLDRSYIAVCDALLRLPGDSRGADREVAWAQELQIPVFTNIDKLLTMIPPRQTFDVSHS